jgi:hypothetical protein
MVDGDKIVRIDIGPIKDGPPPPTTSDKGIKVGADEQEVTSKYGPELKTTPHPYLGDGGHYLEILSADGRHGLAYETAEGKVTSIRAGLLPALQYKEGCS